MRIPEEEPTLESKLVYQGRIVNLRLDTVLVDESLRSREIVEHRDCVCVVALDEYQNVLMVRQYRKPAEQSLLEIPAGGVEDGEDSTEAVLRELQEETEYSAETLRHLTSFWTSPGFCTELMHGYMATNLRPATLAPDEDEKIQVVKVSLERVPDMIRKGEIKDAKSIACLLMVKYLMSGVDD